MTQGLLPPSGPRGQRRPRPQASLGKEVLRRGLTQCRAARGVDAPPALQPPEPGWAGHSWGSQGLPGASPELQPHSRLCPHVPGPRFPGGQAEPGRVTAALGVGEDTPQPPLIRVGRTTKGLLCTRTPQLGAQLTLGVTCQVPLSVTFLHLPPEPAGHSWPRLPSVVFLWPRACLLSCSSGRRRGPGRRRFQI